MSDFGKNDSFNTCLVEIETDAGLAALVGRDPRDITAIWDALYSGSRAHYGVREGRAGSTSPSGTSSAAGIATASRPTRAAAGRAFTWRPTWGDRASIPRSRRGPGSHELIAFPDR